VGPRRDGATSEAIRQPAPDPAAAFNEPTESGEDDAERSSDGAAREKRVHDGLVTKL